MSSELKKMREEVSKAKIYVICENETDRFVKLKIIIDEHRVKPYQRNRFAKGHSYDPLNTYKAELIKYLKPEIEKYIKEPYEGYCMANILSYTKLPVSKRTKTNLRLLEEGKLFPDTRPDSDNIEKTVFDLFNKLIYVDDGQVIKHSTEKFYSINNHKTEIIIKIFKNKGDI